ncbi:SusE domain-containing protein [Seonamhaeicola sp.]|uniref:SusE domain-containing protein n=1 Tax=Seonamhaeicola sp. TaxID=1912245 RepID=UPI0035690833
MKNYIKPLVIIFTLFLSITACDTDDDLVFTAAPQGEFAFNNTFLSEYVLPAETSTNNNIGAVFSFNDADFGVQTNISYELQSSILGDFTDATTVSTLSNANNQIEVSIGTLKTLAEEYGIVAPNSGILNFRVRAFPGDTSSTTEMFTETQQITVTLLEASTGSGSGIEISSWGIVGSGYNNWGTFADAPFYTTDVADVYVAYVSLVDGEIKFRENNEWTNDYGDNDADGTLDAGGSNIAVTEGDYKITLDIANGTYTIEEFSWGVVGSGYNDWGTTPDAKFTYDYVTNTFKVGVKLTDGEIKFRKNNDWVEDFGDTGVDGTLDDGGDNIAVTAGFYAITLDFENGTYTMEETDIWGIVGSGYNDWGATPDFSLTPLSNDIWVAEIVPIVDGEIKFRLNEDWGTDYGDTGVDGTLDGGGDNIAVTAGNYRIMLDLANLTYELNQVN